MTSWAVVADVWFLDPQTIRKDESAVEFATRVQRMIAARAGLVPVDWDGYMKYWKPSSRFIEKQQKQVGDALIETFGIVDNPTAGVELLPETRDTLRELYKSRKESFKMDEKEKEISTKSSSQKKIKDDESKRQILNEIQSLINRNNAVEADSVVEPAETPRTLSDTLNKLVSDGKSVLTPQKN
jgi:glycerol-3-phosphate O-acyltransferase 3/4